MKIYITDVRKAKMCGRGARQFFARHKLDWMDFVKNGIDERTLLKTEDAMAKQCIDVAKQTRGDD